MATSVWKWIVGPHAEGERADRAIHAAIERAEGTWEGSAISVSRSQIQRLIEEGQATLHEPSMPLKSNTKLKAGQRIEVTFPPPRPTEIRPEDRPIEILYEDEHIVVVNKQPGVTVHPSDTQTEGTLVNALLHHIRDLSGIGGELRPGIVHRIDKDTSGVLVISKTDEAHRALVRSFACHDIQRAYWAIVYGAPPIPAGPKHQATIETQLGRNPKDRKKMAVLETGGRKAISHYRKIEEYAVPGKKPFASWLEVTLETGRTHQVRVHMTSIGHSLLGDPVYGTPSEKQAKWVALPQEVREAVNALPGQALHARILGFKHPMTGAPLLFQADPPPSFAELMKTLTRYRA